MPRQITLTRPDDWHLHLRDGAMLAAVLPASRDFARAIVMPNLVPPVATARDAAAYRDRILAALPAGQDFTPLMTLYLTEATDPDDVAAAAADGLVTAVKLYPAGATTNSASGVRDLARVMPVLERMAAIGLPLCVHGEVTDPAVDIFDREAVFIERVLAPLRDAAARAARRDGACHHPRRRRLHRGVGREPRRHADGPSPDPEPQPPARRRDAAASLLPADRQARGAPAGAARGGGLGRPAVLPRHRQRAASAPRQGGGVLRRRSVLGPGRAGLPRAGLRGGGRARPAGGLREPARPGVLRPRPEPRPDRAGAVRDAGRRARARSRPGPGRWSCSIRDFRCTGGSRQPEEPPCSPTAFPPTPRWPA